MFFILLLSNCSAVSLMLDMLYDLRFFYSSTKSSSIFFMSAMSVLICLSSVSSMIISLSILFYNLCLSRILLCILDIMPRSYCLLVLGKFLL